MQEALQQLAGASEKEAEVWSLRREGASREEAALAAEAVWASLA